MPTSSPGIVIDCGAGPEDPVAVILPRSADSVVALLAVFKVGAVYLPMDAGWPADRIRWLMQDAGARLSITHSGTLPEEVGGTRILLDAGDVRRALTSLPGDDLTDLERGAGILARNAAYIIYTSGSTGRPKGVVVEHRGLANFWHHYRTTIYADHAKGTGGARTRIVSTSPLSFDACWGPLLAMFAGHELHLLDDNTRRDPGLLADYMRAHDVNFLDTTPGYAAELITCGLLDDDPATGRPRVYTLIVGADAVPDSLWRRVRERSGMRGLNVYGPTENTIAALIAQFSAADAPVVGQPMANVQAHVLDGTLRPVPVGVVGELYLAGAQLGTRVPGSARADCGAVRGVPVRRRGRDGDVPYR